MKILLVNDDGYNSTGIETLDKELSSRGHEVWVCAPESQRSACSHAIHIRGIKVNKISERHYTCNGFPADCSLYPILGIIPMGKPDVVISGINHGFNVSIDRKYSGTIGAAEEAAIRGIPSIAVSCEHVLEHEKNTYPEKRTFQDFPFEDAAKFVADHLEDFLKDLKPGFFYNINVPDSTNGQWVYTKEGVAQYEDTLMYDKETDSYSLEEGVFPSLKSSNFEQTDFHAVFAKKLISVTIMDSEG